ncbi:hypothetical protein [Methylobacterium gossipiicola]|uniref:Uncharacterized protein n=1 Tax=Methylobacterium gossipiicola TaxID=582675 RepID=A0A1I2UFF6_9HYPH|nr:hypothetical protein [Methylobacterium gossipiicola]SFG73451.1 hypothetical protein SAMN05192565_10986 [Methylobacterium gossipiicola]
MRSNIWPRAGLAAGLLASALAGAIGQAQASPCGDGIKALEGKVKDQARESISASTSGKADAGAREGEGGAAGGKPDTPTAPPGKSAEAGQGSEKAIQAKVALDEARTADGKGDAKGCEAALGRAKQQLDAAP